jgi:hypothetical protein
MSGWKRVSISARSCSTWGRVFSLTGVCFYSGVCFRSRPYRRFRGWAPRGRANRRDVRSGVWGCPSFEVHCFCEHPSSSFAPSHPPLSCRTSPPQGGRSAGRAACTPSGALEIGDGHSDSRSPPLGGRCPAGQRGVRRAVIFPYLSLHTLRPRHAALRAWPLSKNGPSGTKVGKYGRPQARSSKQFTCALAAARPAISVPTCSAAPEALFCLGSVCLFPTRRGHSAPRGTSRQDLPGRDATSASQRRRRLLPTQSPS